MTVTPPVLTATVGTLTPTFSSRISSYTVPDVGYGNHMTIAVAFESGAAVSFLDSSNSVLGNPLRFARLRLRQYAITDDDVTVTPPVLTALVAR